MRKIEKVVRLRNMHDPELALEDLDYWLSRPPDERVAEVDRLRWERHGGPGKIEKVAWLVSGGRRRRLL